MTVKCDTENCESNAFDALSIFDKGTSFDDSNISFLCMSHARSTIQKIKPSQSIVYREMSGNSNSKYSLDKNDTLELSDHDTNRIKNLFVDTVKNTHGRKGICQFFQTGKNIDEVFNATNVILDKVEKEFPDIVLSPKYYNANEFEKYYNYDETLFFER